MCVCYLVQCAYVRLVVCVRAEQEGPEQRLRVRHQLGQDARYQQVHSDGVFQEVLQSRQQDADEGTCGIMGNDRLRCVTETEYELTPAVETILVF